MVWNLLFVPENVCIEFWTLSEPKKIGHLTVLPKKKKIVDVEGTVDNQCARTSIYNVSLRMKQFYSIFPFILITSMAKENSLWL